MKLQWGKVLLEAGILHDRLTGEARSLLGNALKIGEPLAATIEKLVAAFEPYVGNPNVLRDGEPLSPQLLETIVRTYTTDASNNRRLTEFTAPELLMFMNGFRYSAVLDDRTTPVCRFLDGKVFRPDSPALHELVPPNHFNCRSIIVPIVAGEDVPVEDFITPEEVARAKELADAKFLHD